MNEAKVVLLFAGQGSQEIGMGKDLADAFPVAKELLDRAEAQLDFPLAEVMATGPEAELTRTSRCQPALYVHGLMCLAVLRERCPGLTCAAAAGLSLGEFTAHAAAGTFSFEEGLRLVARRGEFMEEACAATEGSMAAMIGGTENEVRALAEASGVDVANLNAPGQIVLSGSKNGIARAMENAKAAGVRMAKELNVAGAYHSQLMASARAKLAGELATATLRPPDFPVIANLTAAPVSTADEIRETLEAQVTGSVRWSDSITRLLDEYEGNTLFLELGPGTVLTGLMGRIRKGVPCHPTGSKANLEAALDALNNTAADS